MELASMKSSPLDPFSAILTGKFGGDGVSPETGSAMIAENRQLLMISTTLIAVLVGCALVLVWRRSVGKKGSRPVELPRPLVVKTDLEPDVDDGKKKVTIFFSTQTDTAEGFAKALVEEAKMRDDKATFKVIDLIAAMFKIGNSKELPAIPDHLSDEGKDFIRQCLQREPSNRPTASELLQHPFVKTAASLEKSVFNFELLKWPMVVSSGPNSKVKFHGVGHARNLSSLDMEGVTIHQIGGAKASTVISDVHMRNISCPVSPIGSPLLNSRSPQHINGRMSPSPISSPRTTSGSSTPLTGGNGAIPFNHPNQSAYLREGFIGMLRSPHDLCTTGTAYHDPKLDLFIGMRQGSPVLRERMASEADVLGAQFGRAGPGNLWDPYDRQAVPDYRVPHQILRDATKLNPSLDLKP